MAYKHDYDKILTRLMTILSRLNNGEELSISELAEEFGVSRRTIQRDFNERLDKFPIYLENKKWKMQSGYRLEKSKSVEDQIVLDVLEKMTESIGGNFALKAKYLLDKIKNEEYNPIYTKLNIEDISDKFQDLQLIEEAIKLKREIECRYDNGRNKPYETRLKPLRIVNFEGFWYLLALNKTDLRKYYLKNIFSIKITQTSFKIDKKIDELLQNSISIWFDQDVEPYEVLLLADESAAKYFKRRPLPTQQTVADYEDGTMELSVKITHEMEILPLVKYWIPHLFVLEPQSIVQVLQEDMEKYASEYEVILELYR